MFEETESGTHYLLTLDNIDLIFMSQYLESSNDEIRPLWSTPVLEGESAYYEVKLVANLDSHDTSYIENVTTVTCHICNIDVPLAYYQEHIQSKIHKSYLRLTEKVLQNVSKQLTVGTGNNYEWKNRDNFFCETCCKVIPVEFKNKHMKSNYHVKCEEDMKLINVFLEIYTKDPQCASQTENKTEVKDLSLFSASNINKIDEGLNYEHSSDASLCESYDVEKFRDISKLSSISNNLNNSNVSNNDIPELSTEENINYSTKEIDTKDKVLQFNLENTIVIETPKGCKRKVKQQNFHGYTLYSGYMFCLLCNRWVETDLVEHNGSECHSKNVSQPINDDFTRELINKKRKHCVLCNVIVSIDSNHSTVDTNHKKYLSRELEKKPNTKGKTYCDVCKVYIRTRNYLFHINSKNHKLQEKTDVNNESTISLQSTNTSSQSSVNVTINYCSTCKVYVPQGGMLQHNIAKEHIKNSLLAQKKLRSSLSTVSTKIPDAVNAAVAPSTSKASITPATSSSNISVSMTTEEKLKNHRDQIAQLSQTLVKCLTCNTHIFNTDDIIVKHVESSRHTDNTNKMLSDNNIIKEYSNIYFCKLCNVDVINFIEHVHENVQHIKKKFKKNQIDKNELRKYVYECPLDLSQLALTYRNKYKDLLKQNSITELDESKMFYCNRCKIKLKKINEIDHMFGERHRPSLPKC